MLIAAHLCPIQAQRFMVPRCSKVPKLQIEEQTLLMLDILLVLRFLGMEEHRGKINGLLSNETRVTIFCVYIVYIR
jgi:hypothetical protein